MLRILSVPLLFVLSLPAQTLREAEQLDSEGKCAQSEPIYQAALSRGAPSPALLNNAGNHYLVCGSPAKAQALFQKLLQLRPEHSNANLQLARLATEQKQGRQALQYLAHVHETDPVVALLRAEALHWAGQADASLHQLESIEKSAAGDARLLYLLGLTCARVARYDRAESAFAAALAQHPEDSELLFNLGRTAARAGHLERAQRALEAAWKLSPGELNVALELGRVCVSRGDHARAVFVLARARREWPRNPEVLLALARASVDAAYYEDAASAFDEYLRLRPGDDIARRDRIQAYGHTESRRDLAGQELAWYLGKYPSDPQGHYLGAQILWWREPDKAIEHLSEAVRLEPGSVSYRFSRAWMLQRAGRMAESLEDLEAALRGQPGDPRILDLMGLAQLALDRPAEAEKSLRQALARSPEDPLVMLHLGRALMALDRPAEAQTYLDRYEKARPPGLPGLRSRSGLIELATLAPGEQRGREIERFRGEARAHPDRPPYQFRLAALLLADGRKEEALQEFRRLLEWNADAGTREQAGSLLLGAGEFALARDFLQLAAKERASARPDLAIALFETGGPAAALQYLDSLPPGDGDLLLLRANVLAAAGRPGEADQALDQALERVSTQPRVVERAVLLVLRSPRPERALTLLERAMAANPQDSELPVARAIALGMMKRDAEAEKALREIELRWPELDSPYLAHGLLLERLGRQEEARRKLQTAAALGSQSPHLRCALARLAGQPPSPECACRTGLDQLLYSKCQS